jgi:hypothetical protein
MIAIFSDVMLATCFILVSCLAYSSTLKMEATYPSETLIDSQRITWHYIPEDATQLLHCGGTRCRHLQVMGTVGSSAAEVL